MINKTLNKVNLIFLAFIFFFFLIGNVFAQNGISLETEIQNIEKSVKNASNAEERHSALVRLARLRQLSGDIEGAARNWLEAAASIPGAVDDDALLYCAFCLAAMGEWDRAAIALEPLLTKNIRASFLNLSIKAIKTGDTSMLDVITDNPEYSAMKHEILFLLWRISCNDAARQASSERWRQRLIAEFPQSPEGRLAASNERLNMIPNPFWFFISGLDSLPLLAGEQRTVGREQVTERREQSASNREQNPANRVQGTVSREQSVTSHAASDAQTTSDAHATSAAQSSAQVTSLRVQTGVFSREANANTQASNLRQAGFTPSIEQRISNNTAMWAVIVPAGNDVNRTIANLRAAGFDGFLMRQ